MSIRSIYENIYNKYDIGAGIEDLLIYREFGNIWYENTSDIGEKGIIIYGAGGNTNILLRMLVTWREEHKIAFIIDSHTKKKELFGITIKKQLLSDDVRNRRIWISSFRYRTEMKEAILDIDREATVIDPYEALGDRIPGADRRDIYESVTAMRYLWFSDRIRERDNCGEEKKRSEISKQLIAGYYAICDWVSLRKEINLYLNDDYNDKDEIEALGFDVDSFLDTMKEAISRRCYDDVVIVIIDAMSKYVIQDMPMLCEWKKNAVEFASFKSECPNTREAFGTFLTGWEPFEDSTYAGKGVYYSDSSLLDWLRRKKVKIKYLSEDPNVIWDYREIDEYKNKTEENALLSEVIFNGICELTDSPERQVVIIHSDVTVHFPHFTPYHGAVKYEKTEESFEIYKKNFGRAVEYTDEMLHFYTDILDCNDRITQIIMGDHGFDPEIEFKGMIAPMKIKGGGIRCTPDLFDTGLLVKNRLMGSGVFEKLVSVVQFKDILGSIMNNNDPRKELCIRKTVPIKCVPGWDYEYVSKGLDGENYYYGLGISGCMNDEYVYLNTEENEDIYYSIGDRCYIRLEDSCEIERAIKSLGEDEIKSYSFPVELLEAPFFADHKIAYSEFADRQVV